MKLINKRIYLNESEFKKIVKETIKQTLNEIEYKISSEVTPDGYTEDGQPYLTYRLNGENTKFVYEPNKVYNRGELPSILPPFFRARKPKELPPKKTQGPKNKYGVYSYTNEYNKLKKLDRTPEQIKAERQKTAEKRQTVKDLRNKFNSLFQDKFFEVTLINKHPKMDDTPRKVMVYIKATIHGSYKDIIPSLCYLPEGRIVPYHLSVENPQDKYGRNCTLFEYFVTPFKEFNGGIEEYYDYLKKIATSRTCYLG